MVWDDALAADFHPDDTVGAVVRGEVAGKVLTLTLGRPGGFGRITYLKEMSWNQEGILMGRNALAALTFCDVPILPSGKSP